VGGLGLLIGLEDGLLSLDDPASKFMPDWQGDPVKSSILVRHLATHTSGLENPANDASTGWMREYWANPASRFELSISGTPIVFTPGGRVDYSNPGFTALSFAISSSLKGSSEPDLKKVLHARIMSPLGVPIDAYSISYGETYNVKGLKVYAAEGGGAYTARAAARVGQFMLNSGRWNGRQLIDPSWIAIATSNAAPPTAPIPDGFPAPGLGWWSNSNGVWKNVPRDAFVGAGHRDQLLVVIPSLNLVAVRFGSELGDRAPTAPDAAYWTDLERIFLNPLVEVIAR
jgi:CubicO group peptidase (beta-lactamase class C family)